MNKKDRHGSTLNYCQKRRHGAVYNKVKEKIHIGSVEISVKRDQVYLFYIGVKNGIEKMPFKG